jgi:integrase
MLTVFRRHTRDCPFYGKSRHARGSRTCANRCPLWVQGTLAGERVRKALNLTAWEAASDLVRAWESAGEIGAVRQQIPTLHEAVEKYIADARGRNLADESLKRVQYAVEHLFLTEFCGRHRYRLLRQIGVDQIREFAHQFTGALAASTIRNRLEFLRGFFRFCHLSGWISVNPVSALRLPKVRLIPTVPFEDEEVSRMLSAADTFTTRGIFGGCRNRRRVRAMILLLRYSGLRISDAATLERARIRGNRLFLYTQKTGTPVWIPLPPHVVDALAACPSENNKHVFWNGRCLRTSAVKIWEATFQTVFKKAGIERGRIHRFRDTFAVRLLEKGVSIETVSVLLGHSSLAITLKYYRPWMQSLQQELEREVTRAWGSALMVPQNGQHQQGLAFGDGEAV